MRFMVTRSIRSSLVAMAVLAAVLFAVPAAAEDPAPTNDPPVGVKADPAVASLAADYGLSLAEAEKRIVWQQRASHLEPQIQRRVGEHYAGIWVDEPNGGRVKLSVAGDASAVQRAQDVLTDLDLASFTDAVVVEHTMDELLAAQKAVVARLQQELPAGEKERASLAAGTEIRADLNKVTVSLPKGSFGDVASKDLAAVFVRAHGDKLDVGLDARRAQTSACDWPFCDPPLRAGVLIGTSYGHHCTAGFPARSRSDNKLYIMTAGHCGRDRPSATWSTRFANGKLKAIGQIHNPRRVWGLDGDMAIIAVEDPPGWNTRAWVFVAEGGQTARDPDYPIRSDGVATRGRVCMSGAVTGTHCGNVWGTNATPLLDGRFIGGLTSATYRSRDGDSGGPVYAYHVAYGLNVGFIPATSLSYFQPVRDAENTMNVDISFHGG
jgi:hypothetical protein